MAAAELLTGIESDVSAEEDRWLSTEEAAKYLDVKPITLYRYAKAGRLHPMRLGTASGTLRYRKSELDSLLVPDSDPESAWRGQNPRGRRRKKADAPEGG